MEPYLVRLHELEKMISETSNCKCRNCLNSESGNVTRRNIDSNDESDDEHYYYESDDEISDIKKEDDSMNREPRNISINPSDLEIISIKIPVYYITYIQKTKELLESLVSNENVKNAYISFTNNCNLVVEYYPSKGKTFSIKYKNNLDIKYLCLENQNGSLASINLELGASDLLLKFVMK